MLLVFVAIALVHGQAGTIYLSPSGNDAADCSSASPCATLSKAVSKATSGNTIVLTKGIYSVVGNSRIDITSGKQLIITSQDGAARTVLLCQNPTDYILSFSASSANAGNRNSTLQGITFQGCGTALAFSFTNQLFQGYTPFGNRHLVDNCVFRSNSIAVQLTNNADTVIRGSTFTNNVVSTKYSSAPFNDPRFYFVIGVKLQVSTSKFISNTGEDISVTTYPSDTIPPTVTLDDVSFSGGSVAAIKSSGVTHTWTKVSVDGYTKARPLDLSSVALTWDTGSCSNNLGCLILRNAAQTVASISSVVFRNNNIADSETDNGGAAIMAEYRVKASNCVFDGNFARNGGAVYTVAGADFVSCLFDGNNATGNGGAIFFSPVAPAAVTLNSGEVRKNEAAVGGGVFCKGSAAATVAIQDAQITSNEAFDGAGFYCGSGCVMNLLDNTLKKNVANTGARGQCEQACVFFPAGNTFGKGRDANRASASNGTCSWSAN